MQLQALEHLVQRIARAVQGEPDERQVGRVHGADRRPVVIVVPGLEHLLDVDGGVDSAGEGAGVKKNKKQTSGKLISQ